MAGIVVWIVVAFAGTFATRLLGWYPADEGLQYVVCCLWSFGGIAAGKFVNGVIKDRFPKFDRWNCP